MFLQKFLFPLVTAMQAFLPFCGYIRSVMPLQYFFVGYALRGVDEWILGAFTNFLPVNVLLCGIQDEKYFCVVPVNLFRLVCGTCRGFFLERVLLCFENRIFIAVTELSPVSKRVCLDIVEEFSVVRCCRT